MCLTLSHVAAYSKTDANDECVFRKESGSSKSRDRYVEV